VLRAGEEVRITLPKSKKGAVVYVPTDYKADRAWPILINYPFLGGAASTAPFKQITGGKGFVILGMNYATQEYGLKLDRNSLPAEQEQFTEALELVGRSVRINPGKVFMGGVSQGGFSATVLGEVVLDRLAGLIILAAARSYGEQLPPERKDIDGKAIFIGIGQKDDAFYPLAKKSAETYKTWGAKVTLEEWPDFGHGLDLKNTKLQEWLKANTSAVPTTRPSDRRPGLFD